MIKNLLLIAMTFGCFALAACSDGGDGEMYSDPITILPAPFLGYWELDGIDKALASDKPKSYLVYNDDRKELDIVTMPLPLFMAAAGKSGTPKEAYHFVLKVQKIGYSENSDIYRFDAPVFEFTFVEDGEPHQMKVVFNNTSEMELNKYLHTLSVNLVIKEILVDGEQAAGKVGNLSIIATEQTLY